MRTIILTLTALTLLTTTATAQNSLEIVWIGYGEDPLSMFGAGATGGDFNNDGYSDVLIGMPGWGNDQGKDYLYLGLPDFFDTASYTFFGENDSLHDMYDFDVSNVLDINEDGIEDFLIPARARQYGGYVDVFWGSNPIDTIPDWHVQKQAIYYWEYFGFSADSCGDINGDGRNDYAISGGDDQLEFFYLEIYHGGSDLDTIADWRYGDYGTWPFEVSGLGDVNGDGFSDVLVYREYSSYPEREPARIFFGGSPMDTIPDLEFHPYVKCGAGIGDVNDDGFCDVALYQRFPAVDSTYTVVYFGGTEMDTVYDVALSGYYYPRIGSLYGISHADINGDGIEDIVCDGDASSITVYLGSPSFNGTADWWYSEFWMVLDGITVNGVGDVNGDGCDEFVLGFPYYDNMSWMNVGKAYLFAGNPDLIDLGASVEPGELTHIPGWYKLDQNFPNPFNASTTIHFELGKLSTINLTVFDLQGQKIRNLITNKEMRPGGYSISWSGRNELNQPVSSGIYILELQVDQFKETRKMVLIR